VDSLIHDEKGYNFDLGIRGESPTLFDYDFSIFALKYNDRIGEVLKRITDQNGLTNTKRFRSNISDAIVCGIEFFGEFNLLKLWNDTSKNALNWFVNSAFVQSKYINSSDPSIEGNRVEYAPNFNLKTGLICKLEKFSSTLQFNYTSSQFSDASNADDHPSAFVGIIPSYYIVDWSFAYKINKYFRVEAGVNNLTNTAYFTKRATGYPGPGILPASGRNFYFTLEFRI
jgi:Fe(3+) dicitrate transport protein